MLKSEIKAQEYRRRAEEALAAAGCAVLDQIRQRHLQAAATWSGLADSEDAQTERGRLMLDVASAKLAASRAIACEPVGEVPLPPDHKS